MRSQVSGQYPLFDTARSFPNGLVYRPDFITPAEEAALVRALAGIPMAHPLTNGYAAKRRIANFGWSFDFDEERLVPGPPLPGFLLGFARKIAKWLAIPQHCVVEALINEYPRGAQLGWHRDNESFEKIVGISLSSFARMRFRPLAKLRDGTMTRADILDIDLEPRSAYIMQGPVRWGWQHSVAATKDLRYSITFRTLPH
jgi:alkylated DNA repair dioxygenase AlkB